MATTAPHLGATRCWFHVPRDLASLQDPRPRLGPVHQPARIPRVYPSQRISTAGRRARERFSGGGVAAIEAALSA